MVWKYNSLNKLYLGVGCRYLDPMPESSKILSKRFDFLNSEVVKQSSELPGASSLVINMGHGTIFPTILR